MKSFAKSRGFTLIELIVVIALMGVASTLGFVMFSKVTGLWAQVKTRTELCSAADGAFASFRQDFADAVSSRLAGSAIQGTQQTAKDERFFRVSLEDDQVVIPVETVVASEGRMQRLDVKYFVDRKNGANALMRVASIPGSSEGSLVKVADGVLAMCIEYAGSAPDSAWHREWKQSDAPSAVRISMTLMDPVKPFEQICRKAVFPIRVD